MTASRVLLVEDDRHLADLLLWHFNRERFEVRTAVDGEEALLLAQESPPDIVILDWMIEGVSGIAVCRRLRRNPAPAKARGIRSRTTSRRAMPTCTPAARSPPSRRR